MYSKLVFVVEGEKIEFHAHELVKMASDIIENQTQDFAEGEKVVIPADNLFDQFFNTEASKFNDLDIANHSLTKYLLIPLHISGLDTVRKWLYVVKQLREIHEEQLLRGWWVVLSGRLLLIKNKFERYSLNISVGSHDTIKKRKKKFRETKNLD